MVWYMTDLLNKILATHVHPDLGPVNDIVSDPRGEKNKWSRSLHLVPPHPKATIIEPCNIQL